MSGQNDQTSKDNIIEAYYEMIGEAHIDNIVNDLNSKYDEIKELNVPKSLDAWFTSFERGRRKTDNKKIFRKNIKKISSKIAIVAVIVITLTTAISFSVEAFRIRAFNFFLQKNETYTVIDKQEDISNQLVPDIDINEFYYLSYLPSGYYYEKHTIINDEIIIQYSNGEDVILFDQDKGNANYQLDTEDANVQEVLIDENQGYLIKKNERVMITWFNNEDSFVIKGYVPTDEIIMMAENMKKNK